MGRGSYNGGSTIINVRGHGWSERSDEYIDVKEKSSKEIRLSGKYKYSKYLKRNGTPFEIAYIQFAIDCGIADRLGKSRPQVPDVIAEKYNGKSMRPFLKMIKTTRFYKSVKTEPSQK